MNIFNVRSHTRSFYVFLCKLAISLNLSFISFVDLSFPWRLFSKNRWAPWFCKWCSSSSSSSKLSSRTVVFYLTFVFTYQHIFFYNMSMEATMVQPYFVCSVATPRSGFDCRCVEKKLFPFMTSLSVARRCQISETYQPSNIFLLCHSDTCERISPKHITDVSREVYVDQIFVLIPKKHVHPRYGHVALG